MVVLTKHPATLKLVILPVRVVSGVTPKIQSMFVLTRELVLELFDMHRVCRVKPFCPSDRTLAKTPRRPAAQAAILGKRENLVAENRPHINMID